MGSYQAVITLSAEERAELAGWSKSRTLPAGDVFKANLILALADGKSYSAVEAELNTSRPTIARWRARFEQDRIQGLESRHQGSRPRTATPAVQARILKKTQHKPADGSTHWSCRKMAQAVGVSPATVHRIWAKTGLKPHRLDRYMASNDPAFEQKAAEIIALYLNPPQHAAVFCVDEKTAIQALDRMDPVLPLSPGRAEKHGFEYFRHGTLSLYAALDVKTGEVHGKTAHRHTSADFIGFLADIVERNPPGKELHIVLDNLSAHKTHAVREFLDRNPRVRFHFTPTYSSWLNQVEIWFAKIERDVIARGVFSSVADLSRKLMKYIRAYSKTAKPFCWKYKNVRRRIVTK